MPGLSRLAMLAAVRRLSQASRPKRRENGPGPERQTHVCRLLPSTGMTPKID